MSLCISLLSKDILIMAGDSRESITVNGEHFSTGRSIHKIKKVGDKVIFMGGSAEVTSRIINDFTRSVDQSVENLQRITVSHKERFISKYGSEYLGSTAHAIFLVGTFEDDIAVLYGINSKDDCKISKRQGGNKLETAIIGPSGMNDRAYSLYHEYKHSGGNDVLEMYQHVYNSVSNEEIGGEMRIFFLTPYSIEEHTRSIEDHREIKIVDIYNRLYNSDELTFYASGDKALWFDVPRRKFIFGGDLEAAGGTFSGDLSAAGGTFSGMLTAASGTFTGTVTAGTIDGSYIYGGQIYGTYIEGADILGSRIRTRAYNSRVELDVDGMEFYDDNNVRRVTLGTHPGANISGHTYYNNYGQSQGLIYAIDDSLHLIGSNELFLRGHGKISVQGVIDFSDATVIGL